MQSIGQFFDGGVEGFGGPDPDHGEDKPAPIGAREVEGGCGPDDRDAHGKMDPGVVLGAKHETETAQCVGKATYSSAQREATHRGFRSEVLLAISIQGSLPCRHGWTKINLYLGEGCLGLCGERYAGSTECLFLL